MSKYIDFSKFHNEISLSVNDPRNTQRIGLKTKDIIKIVQSRYPHISADQIQPADHCINHTNKAPCDCSQTSNAIFRKTDESTGRGRGFVYEVL